ncbi:Serine/threonine-protein kinase PrkC [Thiorhodovibrio winogradskyi]|uniref:non-specific serine/threonine protein kinase n=1 Tax=Thiorhodovibrio winogradskyi TaxID=77007 RepID=A0ABZ0SBP5_9GAMM|nr:serine/threonine-protein kinase [Thiorhodovibrio winogradskyi]
MPTATQPAELCPGCFQLKGAANPCPHCGFDETAPRPLQALPLRTQLNEQFVVGRVLGKPGGFGITYLAWDRILEATVAIKEYLPRELAMRAQDSRALHPHSQEESDLFRYGLEQFLAEARTLAKLDHPNLVRVRQFFEANGTAYLVTDYYQGCSLAEHLERQPGGKMSEPDALALMQPILDGLRAVHAKGFLHRDIKPQNIYLAQTDSGSVRPILLDFGAARQAMGDRSRSLSVVISPGYAPFEQYHRKGQQGPATDIYGAAAVLYRMLTGVAPPEATERMAGDDLRPAADFGIDAAISGALTQALAIKMDERPASIGVFQQALNWQVMDFDEEHGIQSARTEIKHSALRVPELQEHPLKRPGGRVGRMLIVLIGLTSLAGLIGAALWRDAQERARQEAAFSAQLIEQDRTAYAAAEETDTAEAYRAYLSACVPSSSSPSSQSPQPSTPKHHARARQSAARRYVSR